jgi:hypothetical protein
MLPFSLLGVYFEGVVPLAKESSDGSISQHHTGIEWESFWEYGNWTICSLCAGNLYKRRQSAQRESMMSVLHFSAQLKMPSVSWPSHFG